MTLITWRSVSLLGYYCPTPENVKSAQMRFLLLVQNLAPVHGRVWPWPGREAEKAEDPALIRPHQKSLQPRSSTETRQTQLARFARCLMSQEQPSIATSRPRLQKKIPPTFSLYHILSKVFCNGFMDDFL